MDLLEKANSSWRVHDYIYRHHLLHEYVTSSYGDDREAYEQLQPYINLRNEFSRVAESMQDLPDDDGQPQAAVNAVVESAFVSGRERQGYSNNLLSKDDGRSAVRSSAAKISYQWLMSLSSAQAHALLAYSGDSTAYAIEHAQGVLTTRWQMLERAVEASPKVEPFVTYTGINGRYVASILNQIDSGIVTMDRVFSSSLNPAQVNGFATAWKFDGLDSGDRTTLALETMTDCGAMMDVISQAPHELEVLLAKGQYQVVDVLEGVEYLWGGSGRRSGRTIDKTVQLRRI